MITPEILLTLKIGNKLFTDSRRIGLLKAISQTGSLSQAAKLIGISYKTAWDAINEINQLADETFVITSTGGKGGGGAKLSHYAQRFISLYDLLTKMQLNAFNILKDDSIPLDDIFKVSAALSLQSSARNQLYGSIKSINVDNVAGFITVLLQDQQTEINVYITQSSVKKLSLVVGKNILLLIKAPQIEIADSVSSVSENSYLSTIQDIRQSKYSYELDLALASGIEMHKIGFIDELKQWHLQKGKQINIYINPENIIVTTLNTSNII